MNTTRPKPLHLVNGTLRFVLEITALAAIGRWASTLSAGGLRYVWMLGIPLVCATLWATFTVPGDPSRGKTGPVRVSGYVRLGVEVLFFGFAAWSLWALGLVTWAIVYLVTVFVHYVWSHDRTRWLVAQPAGRRL